MTHPHRILWLWSALAVAGAGCSPSLPVASVIDKIRILAMRAEPAEPSPGQEVTLQGLVAQPLPAPPAYSTLWLSCAAPASGANARPCGVEPGSFGAAGAPTLPPSCEDEPLAELCLIGEGDEVRYRPPAALRLDDEGRGQRILTLVASDAGSALDCLVATSRNDSRPSDPDHCVIALKRLPVSDRLRVPYGNQHPAIADFVLAREDGQRFSLAAGPGYCAPTPEKGQQPAHEIIVERNEQAAEPKDDGTYEALSVSWFTDGGAIKGRSLFRPESCTAEAECASQLPPLETSSEWTPRKASELEAAGISDGATRLWVVVRDDRGGVAWSTGLAYVQ